MKLISALPLLVSLLGLASHAAESPVPVQQEGFHRTVFENELLRVIDVQIPAGQQTKYHVHVLPSIIVYLTKSTNRSQTWGETTSTPRETTPGDSRYAAYDDKALSHQVTNPGPAHFRVLDIELLKPPGTNVAVPISQPNVALTWEEMRVRSYRVTLASRATVQLPAAARGYLLIAIQGTLGTTHDTRKSDLRASEFTFFPAGSSVTLRNDGTDTADAVLLELR